MTRLSPRRFSGATVALLVVQGAGLLDLAGSRNDIVLRLLVRDRSLRGKALSRTPPSKMIVRSAARSGNKNQSSLEK